MIRSRTIALAVAVPLLVAGTVTLAAAHESTERTPEVWQVNQRLLISDSATGNIIVLDDGAIRDELSTPPAPISLARSEDGKYAYAIRGRNTDRDHVTMIDTAYDENTGQARRPYVARTWVTVSAGGVHDGHLPVVNGKTALSMEATGELQLLNEAGISGLGSADAGTLKVGRPGHYTYLTVKSKGGAELLHAGSTAGNTTVIDTASGKSIATDGTCPGLHGGAVSADGTQVIFACSTGLLVAPADPASGASKLVAYPGTDRDGSVYRGTGSVLWATNGGKTSLDRIETASGQVKVTAVPLANRFAPRNELATASVPEMDRLYVLTYQGFLQVRDGDSGALLREIKVMPAIALDQEETTEVAANPDLAVASDRVYVTVPSAGKLVSVSLDGRRIVQRIKLGGEPTRMVLLERR